METKMRPKRGGPQANSRESADGDLAEAQPHLDLSGTEIQPFGTNRDLPIVLDEQARAQSCELLNRILADSMILYSLYKKAHWQVAGPTFYQLHLLFDQHASEQLALVDLLAERVQSLGGIAVGDPRHAAELTRIPRAPNGAERVPSVISRLLKAHETIIDAVREAIAQTDDNEDYGTNDLLMSDVLRAHEKQVWFLAEHLVNTPLVQT